MGNVWFAVPSARPFQGTVSIWSKLGYKVAVLTNRYAYEDVVIYVESVGYKGHSISVNTLVKAILAYDSDAEWIVTGGDDVLPDPNLCPDEISRQLTSHFGGTLGVMQPTGDRWGEDDNRSGKGGAYIDHICGSPWLGREFCERAYRGKGPFWPEYYHMFNDEELQEVAIKLGIFLQRRDITHYHDHWQRNSSQMPEFLTKAASRENWDKMKMIFEHRKRMGFPGSELL